MRSRGFGLITIIILIAILGIGTLYFISSKNKNGISKKAESSPITAIQSSEPGTTSKIDIEWSKYQDKKQGFEFSYPKSNGDEEFKIVHDDFTGITSVSSDKYNNLMIIVSEKSNQQNLTDWFWYRDPISAERQQIKDDYSITKPLSINGHEGLEITYKKASNNYYYERDIVTRLGGINYGISFDKYYCGTCWEAPVEQKIFESLKFSSVTD